jgi:hypothetical protein
VAYGGNKAEKKMRAKRDDLSWDIAKAAQEREDRNAGEFVDPRAARDAAFLDELKNDASSELFSGQF